MGFVSVRSGLIAVQLISCELMSSQLLLHLHLDSSPQDTFKVGGPVGSHPRTVVRVVQKPVVWVSAVLTVCPSACKLTVAAPEPFVVHELPSEFTQEMVPQGPAWGAAGKSPCALWTPHFRRSSSPLPCCVGGGRYRSTYDLVC